MPDISFGNNTVGEKKIEKEIEFIRKIIDYIYINILLNYI